jgi:translation initiation factor IF-1
MPAAGAKGKGRGKGKGGGGRRKVDKRRLEDIAKNFTPGSFEVYGKVIKEMGNRRFSVHTQQYGQPSEMGDTIVCSIRGSYRRPIRADSYVLVKLYDFNTSQGQIIDSYTLDEMHALKSIDKWDFPESLDKAQQSMDMLDFGTDTDDDEDDEDDEDAKQPLKSKTVSASVSASASSRASNLDIGMDLGVDIPEMLESVPVPIAASASAILIPLSELDIDAI